VGWWRSGTETTLPARIAVAEQCRCGNREPVEFSSLADDVDGGGGRHCHCHRCPLAVYAKRRVHRARESRDWRHCCWRANAPVRHRSRRAGVITNTCAAVIKPLGPSGFVVVFLLPSRPSAASTAQHRMFVRSLARTARPPPTDAPSSFAHAHTRAEQRRRATATTTTTPPPPRTKYPVRSFVVARVGEGRRASWWGYIAIAVVVVIIITIISLTKQPLQHVFLPPSENAHFSPTQRRTTTSRK